MNKFLVYYEPMVRQEGDDEDHCIYEFDTLSLAHEKYRDVLGMDKGAYRNLTILKNIAVKIEITEVKDES